MLDRDSIIRRLSGKWMGQGLLTAQDLVAYEALAQDAGQPLDVALLESGRIPEETFLHALSEELGCRFWEGDTLQQNVSLSQAPIGPVFFDFLKHNEVVPFGWDPGTGTLHIVMARLPSHSLLNQLRTLLPVSFLHLELAPKEAILDALRDWSLTHGKETSIYTAVPTDRAPDTQSGLDAADVEQADTSPLSPFDMGTIRQDTGSMDMSHMDINSTFAVLSLAATLDAPTLRNSSEDLSFRSGASEQPAQAIARPQDQMVTWEEEPQPFASIGSTDLWQGIATEIEVHDDGDDFLDVPDDAFFLDYQTGSRREAAPQPDAPEPAKSQEAPQPNVEVLDLVAEFLEEPEAPAPASSRVLATADTAPAPTPAPPQRATTSVFGDLLDEEGEPRGSKLEVRLQQPASSPIQLAPRPQGFSPTPHRQGPPSRKKAKEPPKDPKKQVESFLLRYVLGGAVTLVNLAFRIGFLCLVGYLLWFFFWSK